jgi:o-aminophenol oxidase
MGEPTGSSGPTLSVTTAVEKAALPPTPTVTPYVDALRVPPVLVPKLGLPVIGKLLHEVAEATVTAEAVSVSLHSELPPTRVWAYNGHFPGPTIEVRRGQRIRIAWTNGIPGGPYPVTGVAWPGADVNAPGRQGVPADPMVAALPAWVVTHLHGAVTDGAADGYAENAVRHGHTQLSEYPNDQAATTLWYHDHAMNITALNVFAGLAGMYLIRDEVEDSLDLPQGHFEVPLIICDRNLDTDEHGRLTGNLLHKQAQIGGGKLPFTGPFTLVNGTIWPYLEVQPGWYRFRLLNASNARSYRLVLEGQDGKGIGDAAYLIGTDGGLLGAPVPIGADGITLAPAERADVLVDFSGFAGQRIQLVNSGVGLDPPPPTPYGGGVMQFRVGRHAPGHAFTLPKTLDPGFRRLTEASIPAKPAPRERWVMTTPPTVTGMPELWEMAEVTDTGGLIFPSDGYVQVTLPGSTTPRTFRRVAQTFEDRLTFQVVEDSWEIWHFLNIGPGPSHPMHIHLIRFQVLRKDVLTGTGNFVKITDAHGSVPGYGTKEPITYSEPGTLDPYEQGWKDVIRVDPDQMVTVAGQFTGATGRFMYHCHILEHEDAGMMRPILVMPEPVMDIGVM